MKSKIGIVFSAVFVISYLLFFYSFLNFYRNEDVRTNANKVSPRVASRIVTDAIGSVDEHCGEFIKDREEAGPHGLQEVGHIGNKDQFCYFSYKYLLPPSYAVGILPTVLATLINCPNWNSCPREMGSVGYTTGAIVFLAQLYFIAIFGYIVGKVIGRIFRRDKIN